MTPHKRTPSMANRKDQVLSIVLVAGITVMLLISMRGIRLKLGMGGASSEVTAGLTALKEKKPDVARQKFDALLTKSPKDPQAYLEILQACQITRQWGIAVEYAQRGLKAFNGDEKVSSVLYSSLANSLVELKGANWKQEALRAAEEAYRLTPEDVSTQNMYGYLLADLSEDPASIEKAFQILRKAVSVAEESVREPEATLFLSAVLDSYGWALYKKGDTGGAIITLQRAINAIPQEAINLGADVQPGQMTAQDIKIYYYHLGAAFQKEKQTEEARRTLQTALKYDPAYKEAQQLYDSLPPMPKN
ncbi:MAG: tetratricopeptide repeat protein [Armatimonadetes bacterium]|nr:tetratricopeptide repeat protein [Armatimonadota bacterium]